MIDFQTAADVLENDPPLSSPEHYAAKFRAHMARKKLPEQPQQGVLRAGIDCGRWVVNCRCGGGIALHPDWQFAACLSCGRSWTKVEFPTRAFLERVSAVLSLRPEGPPGHGPEAYWSWWPEETIEDLIAENLERGWPIPEGGI